MKKTCLLVALIVLLATGAAGGAWHWHRTHDRLAIAHAAMARGDLRTAQIALRAMVREQPDNGEAHFRLGTVQLQLGDPLAAEKELRLARDAGWNQRTVQPLLARAVLAQARYGDVLAGFSAQGLPPDEAGPLLVTRALAHLGLREIGAAQQEIAEAERLAPEIVEAPLAAARIALARNDPVIAAEKIGYALELNSGSVDALLLRGEMEHAAGHFEAAVATFTGALAIVPDAVNIRLERANTLMVLNQDGRAREDVDAVLKLDARSPLGNYVLTVLLARAGDWQGADAALQKISPVLSRFPRGEYVQAVVKLSLGQTAQAAEAASRYVARMPQDIAGPKLLARIQAQARRPQDVIAVLTRAAEAGEVDGELLELLGGAYIQTGQTALAVQTLERAASLAGDDVEALSRIAGIRLGIGDAGGAERNLARALELAPDRRDTGERLVMAALAAGDVERAATGLEALRRQPGGDGGKLDNLLGLVRMGQLNLDGARIAFAAALAADPAATAARLNLSRVLALQGRGEDAGKLLLALLDREPANAPALAAMSNLLLAEGRPERLVSLLEAARRAAPGNVGMTLMLANVLAGIGETRRCLALLDEVAKQQPASPGVLVARARLQETLGLDREAQDTYRQELAASPSDTETRRRLAELLVRVGDAGEARAVLRRGLEAVPGNPALLQALVAIDFRTGGLDAALATAAALARDVANLPAARALKGGLYMSVQRHGDAAAAYRAELEASPSGTLAVAAAVALNAAGRPVDAQRLLRDWIGREPGDVDAIRVLSALDLQNNHMAEAEQGLRAVLAVQPGDPVALNNLAWIYQSHHDPRARAMAQKAYLLAPGPQSADTLGWILTCEGNAKTGVLLLTQAARSLPGDPAIVYHLAVALDRAGQKDRAIEMLTQLTNAASEFDDKPAARRMLAALGGVKR